MSKKIQIITLGCSKNTVDSEQLHYHFKKMGFKVVHNNDMDKADIAIVNTCGFIDDAKEESIETILNLVEAKKQGLLKKLIVFGCLSQRYMQELKEEIPEIDVLIGNYDLKQLKQAVSSPKDVKSKYGRILDNPGHYAYLKIAEGCNRSCAFCAIPSIKGKYISRSQNDIVEEAKYLADNNVKELLVIAQDLSYYGYDREKKLLLPNLIENLIKIDKIEWIRLHYMFPALFPMPLIDMMAQNPKICNYFDIPFQHISDNMLKSMRRGHTKKESIKLIETIKNKIPNIALRTTMLLGYPGETENDIEELAQFIKEVKFDRLGVFTYSHEENTYAGDKLVDNISEKEKNNRQEYIMQIQEEVSFNKNQEKIGKSLKVIIDRKENDAYIGRTEFDSVEVDNEVIIDTDKQLEIGSFVNVEITNADAFDIFAKT